MGYEEGRDRERVLTLNGRSGGDKEKACKEVERQRVGKDVEGLKGIYGEWEVMRLMNKMTFLARDAEMDGQGGMMVSVR